MKLAILVLAAFLSPSFCSAEEFIIVSPGVADGWNPAMFWHTSAKPKATNPKLAAPNPQPAKADTDQGTAMSPIFVLQNAWSAEARLKAAKALGYSSNTASEGAKAALLLSSVNDTALKVRVAARRSAVDLFINPADALFIMDQLERYANDKAFANKVDLALTLKAMFDSVGNGEHHGVWLKLSQLQDKVFGNMKKGELSIYSARRDKNL